jgi:hypothetical protein
MVQTTWQMTLPGIGKVESQKGADVGRYRKIRLRHVLQAAFHLS